MRSPAAFVLAALTLRGALADQDQGSALRGKADDRLKAKQREQDDFRAVTQVVRMLEGMLKQSKLEGDTEHKLYAKYKCYCDDEEATKSSSIEKKTSEIQLLASRIEETQGSTALKSQEAADLKKKMEDNEQQVKELTQIRSDEHEEYVLKEKDLSTSIGMLKDAIATLTNIGADQALAAQDHTQYMGLGFSQMQSALKQVAMFAAALGKDQHAAKLNAFVQAASKGKAPFTGTYSTQSGEIFGILANMRDTFTTDLEEAETNEKKALETFERVTGVLAKEYGAMSTQAMLVQGDLAGNDDDLSAMKSQKEAAETEKSEAESFLEQLRELCTEKANQYEKRVEMRANEETAIAQAIAILNSDMAFEAFGKVSATSFLQLRKAKKGDLVVRSVAQRRAQADSLLRGVSHRQHSLKAAKIASMLEAENPFDEVLKAIGNMLTIIKEEGEMDTEKKEWCDKERAEKAAALAKTDDEITSLNTRIAELEGTIGSLKDDISSTEESLTVNVQSQTDQTAQRTEANRLYQQNIENLVAAQDLLKKALVVLKAYYEDALAAGAAGTGFLQQGREDAGQKPAPPSTWDEFEGQSNKGGNDAVSMLKYILEDSVAEEKSAHQMENNDQAAYETEMQDLKNEEGILQETLSTKNEELATSEEELLGKQKDLKDMEKLKAEIEAYVLKIKPGCDFLDTNIALRDRNRGEESKALEGARDMIKGTPAYQNAVAAAHNETLGDCLSICGPDEEHVDCKACLAKTSVPGYCAGHADTKGC